MPYSRISRLRFEALACHRRPSQFGEVQALVRIRPDFRGLPIASSPSVRRLLRQFYQAGNRAPE
jgi:hypothetical protein